MKVEFFMSVNKDKEYLSQVACRLILLKDYPVIKTSPKKKNPPKNKNQKTKNKTKKKTDWNLDWR